MTTIAMKIKGWVKYCIAGTIMVIVLVVVFLPSLAKWYIEKHSEEWTGRKITMDRLGLNFFTGGITIEKFKLFEQDKQTVFIGAEEFYVNTELWRAIKGEVELIEVTLRGPTVNIVQHDQSFNYDDLITRFSTPDTLSTSAPDKDPLKYWIRNVSITEGTIGYSNKGIGNDVKVLRLQASCPLIAWNDPQQRYSFQFGLDKGGEIKSLFDLNVETLTYRLQYDMQGLNLDLLYPYLKDYINVGEMKGSATTTLTLYGNFNEPDAIASKGSFSLRDLSITNPDHDPLVSIGSFDVTVDTLNVKEDLYRFGNISLTKPFLKFERFETENNFSRLVNYTSADTASVASDSSSVQVESGNIFELIATYVQDLSEKYVVSNYQADSVILREGTLIFNDYTLRSKFNYFMEHLLVKAERVNSENKNITFVVSSILNTSGKMKGEILVNPNGFRDMVINYSVEDLKISDFNPYSDYYVAHPFLDGVCYYNTKSSIANRFLKSENTLEIRKILVGKKEKNSTAVNLPIRFAVALLRDVNGNIALDVPVEGNLDDPKYRLGPIIWQIFRNLILKAVAAPGKLLAKRSGVDEKLLEGFDWNVLQTELDDEQKKALDAAAKALASAPDMNIEFIKGYNVPKELDQLALQESKKRFLFFNRRIASEEEVSPDEEKIVESVEPKDSVFNAFVDQELQTKNSLLSIFDKSKRLVGSEKLQHKLNRLLEKRTAEIQRYITQSGTIPLNRFRIVDPEEKKEMSYESPSRTVINFYLADEDESIAAEKNE